MCNDLAEAMKALDGKKIQDGVFPCINTHSSEGRRTKVGHQLKKVRKPAGTSNSSAHDNCAKRDMASQ